MIDSQYFNDEKDFYELPDEENVMQSNPIGSEITISIQRKNNDNSDEAVVSCGSPNMKSYRSAFARAFLYACANGNYELIPSLILQKVDVNTRENTFNGLTGLMRACIAGHEGVVNTLLHCDVNTELTAYYNGKEMTALEIALEGKHYNIVSALREASQKENSPPPSSYNDKMKSSSSLSFLQSNKEAPNTPGSLSTNTTIDDSPSSFNSSSFNPLRLTPQASSVPKINMSTTVGQRPQPLSLNTNSNVTYGNTTHGHHNGNNIDSTTTTTTTSTYDYMNMNMNMNNPNILGQPSLPSMTNYLSSIPINNHPDEKKWSELMTECRNGNVSGVASLLKSGVQVNAVNDDQWTALMVAARFNNMTIIRLLLQYGADINATNKYGWTALMMASRHGNIVAVQCLIDSSSYNIPVDINFSSKQGGWTALILAARYNETNIAQALLSAGALINVQNNYGDTALMWAARNNHLEMVRLLLQFNADESIKDNRGKDSIRWAQERGNNGVASLLETIAAEKAAPINGQQYGSGGGSGGLLHGFDGLGLTPWASSTTNNTTNSHLLDPLSDNRFDSAALSLSDDDSESNSTFTTREGSLGGNNMLFADAPVFIPQNHTTHAKTPRMPTHFNENEYGY